MQTHQKALSISSPIAVSFPASSAVSLTRPTHKAKRPSFSNAMESLKEKTNRRLERLAETKDRIHDNLSAYSHRRIHSDANATSPSSPTRKKAETKLYQNSARISEISAPQLNGSADSLPVKRLGDLGKGATLVSTPQEALDMVNNRQYRKMPASSSVPNHIDRYYSRYNVPVRVEEETSDYDEAPDSAPLPSLPASNSNSPAQSHRALQADFNESPPRRSAESSRSRLARQSSRGLGPVIPDLRRSNGIPSPVPRTQKRRSPVIPQPQYTPSNPTSRAQSRLDDYQPRHAREREAEVDPEPEEELRLNREILERPFSNLSAAASQAHSSAFVGAPQIPIAIASVPLQPPFAPVLLSNLPANMHRLERGKVMVILETGDKTIKSTLETLTKRPSFLAEYLERLIESTFEQGTHHRREREAPLRQGYGYERDDGRSMYSQKSQFDNDSDDEQTSSAFNSIFQDHLASTGVLNTFKPKRRADKTSMIHIFLDRPSEPYAHIMAYLRSPLEAFPPTGLLPYAARLFPTPAAGNTFATARLEALLDLRDEASYLGLDDLLALCDEELAGTVPLALNSPGSAFDFDLGAEKEDDKEIRMGLGIGRESMPRERGSEGAATNASGRTLFEPQMQYHQDEGKRRDRKEKGVGMGPGQSPALRSVDIPVLLPSSPRSRTLSTGTNASAASEARKERRIGQVGVPPPLSASQSTTNTNVNNADANASANSQMNGSRNEFELGQGYGRGRGMESEARNMTPPPPSSSSSRNRIPNASQLRAASRERARPKPAGNYF